MMGRRIIFSRPDGGVSVMEPSPALVMEFQMFGAATGTLRWRGPAVALSENAVMSFAGAEAAALEYVRTHDVPPDATDVRIIDAADVPPDPAPPHSARRAKLRKAKTIADLKALLEEML